ncbi:MAG: ribosome small subunit-dependent GTPase A [Synechococcaceae cyanobacterium SM2_3_2]|nr:ribosome small subunit-dependent GTPase A [Synechococcaceae cyanobacterium SM2_3_2]
MQCRDPSFHLGLVRATQANFYRVRLLQPDRSVASPEGSPPDYLCTRRALLKKLGQTVMVGDVVEVSLPPGSLDCPDIRGVVEVVRPRLRTLPRPAIANAEQALIVMALSEPEPDPWGMSRFLVQAEASGLQVRLCFNKVDTVEPEMQAEWATRVKGWGYEPLLVSAKTGAGLEALQKLCAGRISVLTGFSGVGKSSLLNTLRPDLDLATQAVSGRLQHGRHTTRHVELFPTGSGWIADSPGFNRPDLDLCTAITLISAFPEARSRVGSCQFRDCLHQEEPGCRIRDPHWDRYELYLAFLAEVLEREQRVRDSSQEQLLGATLASSSAKPKTHRAQKQAVSRSSQATDLQQLDPRYRRISRRQHKQQIDPLHWQELSEGSLEEL